MKAHGGSRCSQEGNIDYIRLQPVRNSKYYHPGIRVCHQGRHRSPSLAMGKTKIENSSFLLLTLAEMPVSIYKDRKERCSLQSRRILQRERCYFFWTLSSVEVEAPAGIVIIEKWQASGGWWEEENGDSSVPPSHPPPIPLPSPTALSFPGHLGRWN